MDGRYSVLVLPLDDHLLRPPRTLRRFPSPVQMSSLSVSDPFRRPRPVSSLSEPPALLAMTTTSSHHPRRLPHLHQLWARRKRAHSIEMCRTNPRDVIPTSEVGSTRTCTAPASWFTVRQHAKVSYGPGNWPCTCRGLHWT
uniref:Uncharacterized protein n=1 Tax=Mycena chlorophos TaxID=658473 RepID=A0ABQ0KUE5_MYCCL|nr:predicted protein [Mycena chlorophos]